MAKQYRYFDTWTVKETERYIAKLGGEPTKEQMDKFWAILAEKWRTEKNRLMIQSMKEAGILTRFDRKDKP